MVHGTKSKTYRTVWGMARQERCGKRGLNLVKHSYLTLPSQAVRADQLYNVRKHSQAKGVRRMHWLEMPTEPHVYQQWT